MKYVLAPLAGFTDAPFRRLCCEGGADRCYTEMVSAAGLAHGSSPTRHLMETMHGEGRVACQLFGASEDELAKAVRVVDSFSFADDAPGFCEINLNAGCPMTKVTKCGAGAELVKDPAKIGRLVRAMVENTSLPVTVKTRLGPHPASTTVFEIVDAVSQAGARAVIVHARYTSQMHGGEVHYDALAEVVRRSPVPVVGNGSVRDAADAERMAGTGVAEIMIGRAALADPQVFARLERGKAPCEASRVELARLHLGYILEFREQLERRYPGDHVPSADGYASVKMHTHLFRYFSGMPGAAALRARLNQVRTLSEMGKIFMEFQR